MKKMQFMSMRTLDALASCKINPIVFQIKILDVFSTCLAKRPDKNQYTFHKRYGFLTPISMHQKFKHLLLFKSVSVQWTSNNLESFLLTCKEGVEYLSHKLQNQQNLHHLVRTMTNNPFSLKAHCMLWHTHKRCLKSFVILLYAICWQ